MRPRSTARPGAESRPGAGPRRATGGPRGEGSRLVVDWILCDGYGLCGDLAPEVVALDEWRYPILPTDPVERGRVHDVQRAIDCCPMKALRLVPASADRRSA